VQAGEEMDRLPAVNFLTFDLPEDARDALVDQTIRVTLEADYPSVRLVCELPPQTRAELAADLA
jgi:light-regulated signal transduction histidine kinase (bacteriophytochrome)